MMIVMVMVIVMVRMIEIMMRRIRMMKMRIMMVMMMVMMMMMMMIPAGPAVCAAWRCLTRSRSPPSYELDIVIPCDRSTLLQLQIFSTVYKYFLRCTS